MTISGQRGATSLTLPPDDRLLLHTLQVQYCEACSNKDVDAWVELFTDDAAWCRAVPSGGEVYNEKVEVRGHADLRAFATAEFPKAGPVLYVAGNNHFWGGHDEANGRGSVTVFTAVDGAVSILLVGVFEDGYRRTPDGWRFSSRSISILG